MSKSIPTNSVVIFHMSTPPVGWTKETSSFNDHMLRITTGTASSGGSINFSTRFTTNTSYSVAVTANGSLASVGGTTLDSGTMATHNHILFGQTAISSVSAGGSPVTRTSSAVQGSSDFYETTTAGEGLSHSHPISSGGGVTGNTIPNTSGNSLDFSVRYVDVIRARRQ